MNDQNRQNVRHYPDDDFGPRGEPRPQQPSVRRMPEYQDQQVPEWPAPASSPIAQAAAQGNPPPPPDTDYVVTFKQTYQNQDEEVRRVRFRKPTPASLKRFGYPARTIVNPATGQMEGMDILPDRVAAYISELSEPKLLPSTVDRMSFDDFEECSGLIMRFFTR